VNDISITISAAVLADLIQWEFGEPDTPWYIGQYATDEELEAGRLNLLSRIDQHLGDSKLDTSGHRTFPISPSEFDALIGGLQFYNSYYTCFPAEIDDQNLVADYRRTVSRFEAFLLSGRWPSPAEVFPFPKRCRA
jgi:hypothetical protein